MTLLDPHFFEVMLLAPKVANGRPGAVLSAAADWQTNMANAPILAADTATVVVGAGDDGSPLALARSACTAIGPNIL